MSCCLLVFKIIRQGKCRIRSSVFILIFNVIIHFDSLIYIDRIVNCTFEIEIFKLEKQNKTLYNISI